jgi:hypothetical protein
MAITEPVITFSLEDPRVHERKHPSNFRWSILPNTRRMISALGIPFGSFRYFFSYPSWVSPKKTISSTFSTPHTMSIMHKSKISTKFMLFTPVDPGSWDQGKFGSDTHYFPPSLLCRLFFLFLEGFYNAVAMGSTEVVTVPCLCRRPGGVAVIARKYSEWENGKR